MTVWPGVGMTSVRTTRSMLREPTMTTPDLGPAADAWPGPVEGRASTLLERRREVAAGSAGGGGGATGCFLGFLGGMMVLRGVLRIGGPWRSCGMVEGIAAAEGTSGNIKYRYVAS